MSSHEVEVGQTYKSVYPVSEGRGYYLVKIKEVSGNKIKCEFQSLYGNYWLDDTITDTIEKLLLNYKRYEEGK